MNAMLGHEWLPTGILALTSVITTVRYGTKQRVLIRTEGSALPHEITLPDLPQFVTKAELFLRRVIERTRGLLEQEQLESAISEQLGLDVQKTQKLASIQAQEPEAGHQFRSGEIAVDRRCGSP